MELYIPPERPQKYKGKFLKGNIPGNKGKKWEDFYSEETIKKLRDHLKKIQKMKKPRKNPITKEVKVIAIKDGKYFYFPSAKIASQKTGANHGHIIQCCRKKAKTCGGFKWFYENDEEWIEWANLD